MILVFKDGELKEEIDRLEEVTHDLQAELKTERTDRVIERKELNAEIVRQSESHEDIITRLTKTHQFEMDHFEKEEVRKVREENEKLVSKVAVIEKELEMNKALVDLNGDIIDVKDLVHKLIEKLPQIDIKNLSVIQD